MKRWIFILFMCLAASAASAQEFGDGVEAYEKGELYRTRETVDEEAKKILFGQTDTAAPV